MKKTIFGIGTLLLIPFMANAINVTVPQSSAYGQVLIGNATGGNYTPVATSTIGISTLATSTASLVPLQTIFSYGDSITLSVGASSNQNAWPSVLQTMSGYGTWREGVSGAFSVDIKNRILAEPASQLAQPTTILAGYNDATNGVSSTTIENNIALSVAGLKTNHYLILGIPTGSNTPSTTPAYTVIVSVNSFLANTYGNNFLDIRQYLMTKGNGSAQDNSDIFGGLVPSSLRADYIHPNDLGNYYIAQDIYQNAMSVLVAPPTATIVNQYQLLNALANPPTIGAQKQAPAYFSYLYLNSNQVSASSTSFGSQLDNSEINMADLTLFGTPSDGNHPYPTDNMSSAMMIFRDSLGGDSADIRVGLTANGNLCFGQVSCLSMTNAGATQNTALGGFTLVSAVNVQNMLAFGTGALQAGTGGNNDVAVGVGSQNQGGAGVNNVSLGTNSLSGHGTGNVALGQFSGGTITTGNYNIFIGNNTGTFGKQITTGTDNLIIGEQAFNQGSSTAITNASCLGAYCEIANDNTFILGPTAYNQAIANYEPNVGVGTTTPTATVQIVKPSGIIQDFFKISSSTSISNAQDIFRIDAFGHAITSGPATTVTGGTSSVSGNDSNGIITLVGTSLTSLTLNFAHAWVSAPDCTASVNSLLFSYDINSISTTQVTFGFSGASSATIWYQCAGHQ